MDLTLLVSQKSAEATICYNLNSLGPLFLMSVPSGRFAAGDAVYTEMIATNIGNLGFDQPIGAASFYREFIL